MNATAKDLRFHTKQLLDTAARGEEVVITYRGKPYAKLVPLSTESIVSEPKDELFGIWADRDDISDVDAYVRNIRKSRFNK